MPEDDKKKKGNTQPKDDGDSDKKPKMVSYTQAELDQMFAQRADRASRNAVSTMLEDLGYDDKDSLKEALSGYKDYLDNQKSTQEKLEEDLETANTEASDLKTQLANKESALEEYMLKTSVMSAARDQKFLPESIDDVWMYIVNNGDMKNGLKVDDEEGVVGADDVVKKVATKRPHWVQSDTRKGTPSPRGAGVPPKSTPKDEPTRPLVNF